MLQRLLENETAEAIELTNRVRIQVNSASYTRTRGFAIAVAILDELAFWPTDSAANPDREMLAAIRPGQVQFGEHAMLLCASSPYAKRGALFEAYQRHYGQDGDRVLVWRAPTRDMNPTIAQLRLISQWDADPADATAEYLAELAPIYDPLSRSRWCAPAPITRESEGRTAITPTLPSSTRAADQATASRWRSPTLRAKPRFLMPCARYARRSVPALPWRNLRSCCTSIKFSQCRHGGDRYAGEWPREAFRAHGISYEPAEMAKSELYLAFLPMMNSFAVRLIDHPRLTHQLVSLERKVTRGGRDTIDHMRGAHDDIANAVAGACVIAQEVGAAVPLRRMTAYAIGRSYNPLATREENLAALAREERQSGWYGDERTEQQAYAEW